MFLLLASFVRLQASSSEDVQPLSAGKKAFDKLTLVEQLTQELLHAVEDATIDEDLIEKSTAQKRAEQENIDQLRFEIAVLTGAKAMVNLTKNWILVAQQKKEIEERLGDIIDASYDSVIYTQRVPRERLRSQINQYAQEMESFQRIKNQRDL